MEEKKEQLRLTNLRWNVLRRNIGRSIIDYFQTTDQKKEVESEKFSEEITIEQILTEASAYGLRDEVHEWALKEMSEDPSLSKLDAYVIAYNEWIK